MTDKPDHNRPGWRLLLVVAVVICLAAVFWTGASQAKRPVYQGKTANDWLAQIVPAAAVVGSRLVLHPTNGVWGTNPVRFVHLTQERMDRGEVPYVVNPPQTRAGVRAALTNMGTAVIPELLRMLRTRDTGLRRWATTRLAGQSRIQWRPEPADILQARALEGFQLMGAHAGPAVSSLVNDLQVIDRTTNAALALRSIGTREARIALGTALATADPVIRSHIAGALKLWVPGSHQPLFEALREVLGSTNAVMHPAALKTLGQTWPPDQAIPMIIPFLDGNQNSLVRSAALEAVGAFGNEAARYQPAVEAAFADGAGHLQFELNRTLRKIAVPPAPK